MKKIFCIALVASVGIGMIYDGIRGGPVKTTQLTVTTPDVPTQYIGKVAINDNISIRLLVLKHSYEAMADGDARMAIQAANLAATKGLSIKDIGNYNINRSGRRSAWGKSINLPELKKFVSEQMNVDANPGDTLVIFTIGHGFGGGGLDNLGQREVLRAIFCKPILKSGSALSILAIF